MLIYSEDNACVSFHALPLPCTRMHTEAGLTTRRGGTGVEEESGEMREKTLERPHVAGRDSGGDPNILPVTSSTCAQKTLPVTQTNETA